MKALSSANELNEEIHPTVPAVLVVESSNLRRRSQAQKRCGHFLRLLLLLLPLSSLFFFFNNIEPSILSPPDGLGRAEMDPYHPTRQRMVPLQPIMKDQPMAIAVQPQQMLHEGFNVRLSNSTTSRRVSSKYDRLTLYRRVQTLPHSWQKRAKSST